MSRTDPSSMSWITVPENDDHIVVRVGDRLVLSLISVTETGSFHLRVAGFDMGESKWVGERKNLLSFKVEQIPKNTQEEMLTKIREALPDALKPLPISFLQALPPPQPPQAILEEYIIDCVAHDSRGLISKVSVNGQEYDLQLVVGWLIAGHKLFVDKNNRRMMVYPRRDEYTGRWFLTIDPQSSNENDLAFLPKCTK